MDQLSQTGNPSSIGDVVQILKGFGVLKRGALDGVAVEELPYSTLNAVMQDPLRAAACVLQLFPDGIPISHTFFDALDEFRPWIGTSVQSDEAIGLVWAEAMRTLPCGNQEELLNVFANQPSVNLFNEARSLSIVLKRCDPRAGFLVDWFTRLIKSVERDAAQGYIWEAIRAFAEAHVDTALQVIKQMSEQPDWTRRQICGFLLGIVRPKSISTNQQHEFENIEQAFKHSTDSTSRAVFNRSWVTTARVSSIEIDVLDELLSRGRASSDDLDVIVEVVCHLISITHLASGCLQRCHAWLSANLSPSIALDAKFSVAHMLRCAVREATDVKLTAENGGKWICQILPVPASESGIWSAIEDFLCEILAKDWGLFQSIFCNVCDASAADLHAWLSQQHPQRLLMHLAEAHVSPFATSAMLNRDPATRRLGLFLFNELSIPEVDGIVLNATAPDMVKVLFYETQLTFLAPTTIGRILAAMFSIAQSADQSFREAYDDELRLQCQNFGGGVRSELAELATDNLALQSVLAQASEHAEDLKRVQATGINAIDVEGHQHAVRVQRRRFSKVVEETADRYSPFAGIFKKTQLVYGDSASHFMNGCLSDATRLSGVSTSMEAPFIEFFDPERMALRRIRASREIDKLLGGSQGPDHG